MRHDDQDQDHEHQEHIATAHGPANTRSMGTATDYGSRADQGDQEPDHTHARSATACALCNQPKAPGGITCWTCYRTKDGRHGYTIDARQQLARYAEQHHAQAPRFAVMGCGTDGLLIDTQAPDTLEQPALLACLPYDDAQHYARALNQGAARMAADLDRAARLAVVLADAMVRVSR